MRLITNIKKVSNAIEQEINNNSKQKTKRRLTKKENSFTKESIVSNNVKNESIKKEFDTQRNDNNNKERKLTRNKSFTRNRFDNETSPNRQPRFDIETSPHRKESKFRSPYPNEDPDRKESRVENPYPNYLQEQKNRRKLSKKKSFSQMDDLDLEYKTVLYSEDPEERTKVSYLRSTSIKKDSTDEKPRFRFS